MQSYPLLFSPLRLNRRVTVRNRVIMAPMNTNYARSDGFISEQYANYFIERAKGGTGLIVIAPGYVDPRAKKRAGSLLLDEEKYIPPLRKFTAAIHREGAAVIQQLNHNGRLLTSSKEFKTAGGVCVGPSPIPHKLTGEVPQVMTHDDIQVMVRRFVTNAVHAEMAGYDGVEVHGAHGYLINQFLSRYSNKRTDEYGGSLENRMRFALEIVRGIRAAVDRDFLVSFRLEAMEFNPGGVDIEEAAALGKALEKNGVDLLNVTAGNTESPPTALRMFPPTSVPQGCYGDYAARIKQAVSVPVSIMGRIASPERAEEILAAGQSDLVTIGRGLLADSHWVEKCMTGRRAELRQCIGCLQGCYEQLAKELPLTCIYNPFIGKEGQELPPANPPVTVWVAGGGPAGMEAARVCALRGHMVSLFEAESELGGQVPLASIPIGKAEFMEIVRYYSHELRRLGVTITTGKRLTADDIVAGKPDAVILATGSTSLTLPLPGLDGKNVISGREALTGSACGKKVVVCGGGLVGVETALTLHARNHTVELIEMRDAILADAGSMNRAKLLLEVEKTGIAIHTGTTLLGVKNGSVLVETKDGEEALPADTVVLALGARADQTLEKALRESGYQGAIHAAGDCVRARKILEAVAEGAEAALCI